MKTLFKILLCSLWLTAGCGLNISIPTGIKIPIGTPPITPPVTTPVTPPIVTLTHSENMSTTPGAVGTLQPDLFPAIVSTAGPDGRLSFTVPNADRGTGASLVVSLQGYVTSTTRLLLCLSDCEQPGVVLMPAAPPVPAPPTRDQALLMNLTFQGLTCQTDQFGSLNWFEPAISWLSPSDRQKIYACKKAVGDTHLVLGLPAGWPLYNETGNDFSPDRFGPLDWTSGETKADGRLADLIIEVRQAGLIPVFISDETNEAASLKLVLLALDALQHSLYGDITNQVGAYLPGWDGVFYGWPDPHSIPLWATQVRAVCPDCRLGLEFNPGHIPLGSGPQDYTVSGGNNGSMADYDLILGEVDGWLTNGTTFGIGNWQVLKRMLGPSYIDDPGTDPGDAPWPFYLQGGSPRGPYQFCVFEYDEYGWVRHRNSAAGIAAERAYLRARGVKCTG